MQRPLESFPLSSTLLSKLKAAGFEVAGDLKDTSVVELSRELGTTTSEAMEILSIVLPTATPSLRVLPPSPSSTEMSHAHLPADGSDPLPDTCLGRSALELLRVERSQPLIVTFSSRVDDMLGGGVAMGKITEFCGAPGIGKTQFSMQLAVDVRIPEPFGGVGGEAVYIDTEGSFIVERVAEMATAAVQHISSVAEKNKEDPELAELARNFTLERVLEGIHHFRCHDYVELVALVNILPQFVSQHPQVRLVVVDSVAAPFRHGFEDMGMRNRVLSGMAQSLIRIATLHNLAIVLTNQMTTKPHPQNHASSQLVPALGESWGHLCTVRVVLYWNHAQRFATLYKSPMRPEAVVPFQITRDGVRDVFEDLEMTLSQECEVWQFLSSTQLDQLEIMAEEGEYECGEAEFLQHAGDASPHPVESGHSPGLSSRKRPHPEL